MLHRIVCRPPAFIKGHEFALEALPALVDRFPALHWVVLGEGDERAALEARAQALNITDHVHFMGFQPDPSTYYAAANIYCARPCLKQRIFPVTRRWHPLFRSSASIPETRRS